MSARTDLAHIISDNTLKNGYSKRYTQDIAAYLLASGMVKDLDSIMRDVHLYWQQAGYLEVIATTAYPLEENLKNQIKQYIKQIEPSVKKIIISENYDRKIIGGLSLSLPEKQLDLSLRAKLNKFKQAIETGKE